MFMYIAVFLHFRPEWCGIYTTGNSLFYKDRLMPASPVALVGGPRAHQDQYRGFKSHRVHARKGLFLA